MALLGGDKKRLQQFEQLKHAAAQARLPYDRDVWLNLAFYLDYQYVEWVDNVNTLRIIPRQDDEEDVPRPVVNKIMHFVNQEHAYVLQTKPTVDVLPATDDALDMSETAVALAYLRYLAEPQVGDFESVLSEATMWALLGGEGYIKWVYNPRLKRPDFMSVSPLDLYVDPYATSFNKARYVIHTQFMDVEQVYDLYGVEVPPNAVKNADATRVSLLRDMGQAPVLSGVDVNELWMKPCRRYPEGLYCVWTAKQFLVEPQPYPYQHKRLPFTQLGSIPRPGSAHYSSAVKYLRSAQMELNKYHAQKIMNREAFSNPKWWIPAELELEEQPDDSPRQILRGHSQGGALKPEIIQPSGMLDNNDGAWIVEEMMHVVGLHEVSQAQVPGRVEAAKAIEMLKEADAGRQSELLRTIKMTISEGFWQCLMLAKQYVTEEQILQTYSREGMPEVKRFKSENIKPGIRIQVTMGTGLARSRAARQDQLMLMWENQIIQDPEVMAELLEVPVPTFVSGKVFDIRLARSENYEMQQGTAITPNSWDDHEIHLREHNNYRKTQEFLLLPTETKQMFEYHCQSHETLQTDQLVKMARKQAAMQMALQSPVQEGEQTPPGEPAPSPGPSRGQTPDGQNKSMNAAKDKPTAKAAA